MRLNTEDLDLFLNKVFDAIRKEIVDGNRDDNIQTIIDKYNLSSLYEDTLPCCDYYLTNPRAAKILVISFGFNDTNSLKMAAKKQYGVHEDRIEFVEYKTNFDYSKLRYSSNYSDIFVGPIPHKGVNVSGSSFLADAESHSEDYPKIHRMTDSNGTLKVTKTSFLNCLANSNLVKECLC